MPRYEIVLLWVTHDTRTYTSETQIETMEQLMSVSEGVTLVPDSSAKRNQELELDSILSQS